MKLIFILLVSFTVLFGRGSLSISLMQELWLLQSLDKNQTILTKSLPKSVSNVKYSIESENFIIYSGNNQPTTTIWNDYNKNQIPDYLDFVSDELEYIYNELINNQNFRKPESIGKIKIYIANSGLYLDGSLVSMSSGYAGWSIYENSESYMVINGLLAGSISKTTTKDLIKITLAHEFFHLVQYSYSQNFYNKNLWLFEGSSVFMEYLIYPDIKDYLKSYGDLTQDSIRRGLIDGSNTTLYPYATNLFFDFLYQKFKDDQMLHKVWENFEELNCSIKAFDLWLNEYDTNLDDEYLEYVYSVIYDSSKFSNSDLFEEYVKVNPNLTICNEQKTLFFGLYAVVSNNISTGCDIVQIGANDNMYNITFYDGQKYLKGNTGSIVGQNGLVLLKPNSIESLSSNEIKSFDIKSYKYTPVNLKYGWNLLGTHKDISINELDKVGIYSIWKYDSKTNNWLLWYFDDEKDFGFDKIDTLNSGDGFWVNSNYGEVPFDLGDYSSSICDFELVSGWNLKGNSCLNSYKISKLNSIYNIQYAWIYDGSSWKFSKYNVNGFEIFSTIGINQGSWIKK